jgi:O-antigen/teichoic acid export membrane protein
VSGIVAGLIAIALSFIPGIGAPPGDLLLAAIVYSFFNTILLHVRSVFRAFEIMNLEAVSIVQEKALVIALCGAALAFRRDAGIFLAGMAGAYALAAGWALLRLRRFRSWQGVTPSSRAIWREVVRPALPFALMNLFAVIYFRSGTIMLKAITGSDALVGYYNAGFRLIESYMFLPALISVPIYPVLVRSIADGRAVASLVGSAVRGVLVMTGAIALPLALFRTFFTRLLFGEEFLPAADVVGFIALTMLPVGLNFVMGTLVAASGRQGRANVLIVGVTALNLALNAVLIPRWGVHGAAFTTLATELLLAAASVWVTRDLWRARSEPRRG